MTIRVSDGRMSANAGVQLSDQEWLDALDIGGEVRVHITGEGAPTQGFVVYKNLGNSQIATRLVDDRLCKFLDGARLRGQGEFITRPPEPGMPAGLPIG